MALVMRTVIMLADNWSCITSGNASRVASGCSVLASVVDWMEETTVRHGATDANSAPRARHGADEATWISLRTRRRRRDAGATSCCWNDSLQRTQWFTVTTITTA